MNPHTFIEQTAFKDLLILHPRVFGDSRGYFFESYNRQTFAQHGLNYKFIQDNEAQSCYGVVRGLHFQQPPYAQAKLVRVVQGSVLDVVVDLRPDSPTYGQHFSIVLSAENKKQLLVPRGFAHGYAVLSQTSIFCYKCDNSYNKSAEGGIHCLDPNLAIDWQISHSEMILSEKDKKLPFL